MSLTRRGFAKAAAGVAFVAGFGGRKRGMGAKRRHDQGRRAAFAVGHHGDQRDDAEGRHADAHRGAEQEGRPARQEARGRGRRPGLRTGRCSPKRRASCIAEDKVAAVFGCWTSVSRKSVLPVFEELNGILFYPVQYEGEESERNVFYTGAAPNQQAIPAVDYLMSEREGRSAGCWPAPTTSIRAPPTRSSRPI